MSRIQASVSAHGARNLGLAQVAKFAIYLLGLVILSRLLGPTAFGVAAIAMTFVGFAEYFRDFGLSVAAVREKELSDLHRDGLLWTNIAAGLVLTAITWGIAPVFASAFDLPQLEPVLRGLSFMFLINGLGAQYRAGLTREQRFSPLALADSVGPLLGLISALVLAWNGFGVDSLVAQYLVTAFASTVILMLAGRWVPRMPRRAPGIGRLYSFGANYAVSQLIGYVGNNVDTLALGAYSTPTAVGVYSRSFQLVIGVLDQIKAPAMTIALPALSHVRDRRADLSAFLARGQLLVGYLTIPVAAIMFAGAEPLVNIILGPGWLAAIGVVAALSVAGALQQLATVASWLFVTTGHASGLRNYMTVSTIIKVAVVLATAPHGALAVAIGYSAATALAWPLAITWACRAANLPPSPILLQGLRLFAAGVLAGGCGWILSQLTAPWGTWVSFFGAATGALAGYAVLALLPIFRRDAVVIVTALRLALSRKSK